MAFRPVLKEQIRSCDLDCGSEEITKQSFKDECDIHKILDQYKKTGIINHITPNQPMYLDLPDNLDYQASLNLIMEAQEAFQTLPSAVRDRYGNNPENFLEALNDPKQRDFLEEIGVFQRKIVPSGVPAAPPPGPAPEAAGSPEPRPAT